MGGNVAQYLSLLQLALRRRQLCVVGPLSAVTRRLAAALLRVGLLQSFAALPAGCFGGRRRNGVVLVCYLRYIEQLPVFAAMRPYWALRRKLSAPSGGLRAGSAPQTRPLFLVSTARGFLTGAECARYRCGGLLLCALFVLLCDFRRVMRWCRGGAFLSIRISSPMRRLRVSTSSRTAGGPAVRLESSPADWSNMRAGPR